MLIRLRLVWKPPMLPVLRLVFRPVLRAVAWPVLRAVS